MAYPKRLNCANVENQERAITAYKQFMAFILSQVKKRGIKSVLTQYKTAFKSSKYFWLKEAYISIITFAQDVELKKIAAPKPPDPEDNMPMKLPIVRLYAPQTLELN